MRALKVVGLLLVLLAVALVAVFWLQNVNHTVRFGLDLGAMVGAWQIAEPVPVPVVMFASFAAGALFAGVVALVWGLRHSPEPSLDGSEADGW